MGGKPLIPHATVQKALLEEQEVLKPSGHVQGPSHQVWLRLEEKLKLDDGRKMTANHLYVYLKRNSYDIYNKILAERGIERPVDDFSDEDGEEEDNEKDDDDEEDDDTVPIVRPKKTFQVLLQEDRWKEMKPIQHVTERNDRTSNRVRWILPQYKYQPIIVRCLSSQHKLPCAYTFKHGKVYVGPTRECFIKIEAQCRECGAEGVGQILTEPKEGECVQLLWTAEDTRGVHHEKKRPLSHYLRDSVSDNLQGRSTTSFRKRQASTMMDQGDVEPPDLFSNDVLRKAKQQKRDKNLAIPTNQTDPVKCLQAMKHTEPYAGSIHQIGMDPFFVHYHSPEQMHILKSFSSKQYIVMAIDATGSVVQKLRTPTGRTAHIFLYECVINAGDVQLPVAQLLSERQDTSGLIFWLTEFMKHGAPFPNEVVIDNSKALKNAVAMTFCECKSLSDYFEKCIQNLSDEKPLPKTYLRLDIAHLIGGACKWKEWRDKSLKRFKTFYVKCVGLLAQSLNVDSFRQLFEFVGIVATASHTNATFDKQMKDLMSKIEGVEIPEEDVCDNFDEDADEESIEETLPEQMHEFVAEIKDSIKMTSSNMTRGPLNAYYAPDLVERFYYLLPDFLLWTGVMMKPFKSSTVNGSSARVESDFSDLKNGILEGNTKPLRVDKMVATHLKAVNGSCKIAGAQKKTQSLSQNNEDRHKNNDLEESLNEFENWRGLGSPQKKKKHHAKYLQPIPELSLVMQANALKLPGRRLLTNGLHSGLLQDGEDTLVYLKNTCSFDSLAQTLANGYIQYQQYRDNIEDIQNYLLNTCKSLAVEGAVKKTYLERLQALKAIVQAATVEPEADKSLHLSGRTRSKCTQKLTIVYDCEADPVDAARDLLHGICSVKVEYKCSKKSPSCKDPKDHVILFPDLDTLVTGGLEQLDRALLLSLDLSSALDEEPPTSETIEGRACASHCDGSSTITCTFGPHLIISVDHYGAKEDFVPKVQQVALADIPVQIHLCGTRFVLVGVTSRQLNHFVAFTRRATGTWELNNDLASSVKPRKSTTMVSPVLLVYIKFM